MLHTLLSADQLGQAALDLRMPCDHAVRPPAHRLRALFESTQTLQQQRAEREHAGADAWIQMRALAPSGQDGQRSRRLRPALVQRGQAGEHARHQPVEFLLQCARLLTLGRQRVLGLLTPRTQGLDLGAQCLDPDLQIPLQCSSLCEVLAYLGDAAQVETIARCRPGRRRSGGPPCRQDRHPEHKQRQAGAQSRFSAA
jgi:hypothetical protein